MARRLFPRLTGAINDALNNIADAYTNLLGNLAEAFANAVQNLAEALRPGTNPPPVAADDVAAVSEDDFRFQKFDVLSNDTGNDIKVISAQTSDLGTSGNARFNAETGELTLDAPYNLFQHLDEGETALVDVTYVIEDANGRTDTGMLQVTIIGENDDPTFHALNATFLEDDPEKSADLLEDYEDKEGHEGTVVLKEITSDYDISGLEVSLDGSVLTIDNPDYFDSLLEGERAVVTVNYDVISKGHIQNIEGRIVVEGQLEAADLSVTVPNFVIDEGTTPEIDFGGLIFGMDSDGLNRADGYELWVVGGDDAYLFWRAANMSPNFVTVSDGAITPTWPFDFENPQDLNGDNVYELEIALADYSEDSSVRSFSPPVKVSVTVADTDYSAPPEMQFQSIGPFLEEGGELRYDLNEMLINREEGIEFSVEVFLSDDYLLGTYPPSSIPRDLVFDVEGSELVVNLDQFSDLEDYQYSGIRLSVTAEGPDGETDKADLEFAVIGDSQPGVPAPPGITVDNPEIAVVENTTHIEGFGIHLQYGGLTDPQYFYFVDPFPELTIVGGADAHLFREPNISSTVGETGDVIFRINPDFENPRDANGDNIYEVEVAATDGVLTSDPILLRIEITDDADEPDPADYWMQDAFPGFTGFLPQSASAPLVVIDETPAI